MREEHANTFAKASSMYSILLVFMLDFAAIFSTIEGYEYIGCWKTGDKVSNASQHESIRSAFGPIFKELKNVPLEKQTRLCSKKAREKRLDYFVVANDGCRGDVHTGLTYRKYGKLDDCNTREITSSVAGIVYGESSEERLSEADAVMTAKQPQFSSKRSKINSKMNNKMSPEIIKKDIILMNKVFKRVYGDNMKYYREPRVLEQYPDNEHFYSYYANEADGNNWQKSFGDQKHNPKSQNLFENPHFEQPLLKANGHKSWNCYGEIFHGHAGVIHRTTEHKHDGKYAGICSHRIGYHAGPGQFVGHAVKGGHAYKIHGWTKLLNASKDDLDKIELWIRYQGNEIKNNSETRMVLAKRDKFNKNDDWQEWNTQFALPAHKSGFRYVQIYFKGPKYNVNIAIDGMVLSELPLVEDWLKETKARTDKLRKRHVKLRLNFDPVAISKEQLKSIRLKVTQKRHHFGFGSAVHHRHLENPAYRNFFLQNFEWGVPENAMKWNAMEEKKGTKKHCDMDNFVSTLHKYNVTMRGHCIFWDVDVESPKWLDKLDKKHLFKAMKQRIKDTVHKYKAKIAHWDVNNEMLHGSYFADRLGPKIRDWMFKKVHKEDKHSRLFLNDFDVIASGIYTQSYLEQILGFKKRGAPIHGIGVQGHFVGWTHPSILKERLDILGQAGIPIWITEMDILEHNETNRAKSLEYIMRVAYGHPAVAGIMLWAFWSKSAWRGADTALIDDKFDLNKAGRRYLELRKEWNTKLTIKPSLVKDGSCEFEFRGYHGIYDVTVLFPDGQKITNEINLTPKAQPLVVEINTHITD